MDYNPKGHKESDTAEQWAPNSLYFCGLSVIFSLWFQILYIWALFFFWWVWPKVYQFCLSFQRTDLCFICFYCLLVSILFICSNPFFLSYYPLCHSLYFFFFLFPFKIPLGIRVDSFFEIFLPFYLLQTSLLGLLYLLPIVWIIVSHFCLSPITFEFLLIDSLVI